MTKVQTLIESTVVFAIVAVITLIGNYVGFNNGIVEALPGIAILFALCFAGLVSNRFICKKLPTVLYVITYGVIITLPSFPGAAVINAAVAKVHFLALTTPILAYAGVSIGKDLDALKRSGWRIVVVSIFVMISTYIASAAVANVVLKMMGEI